MALINSAKSCTGRNREKTKGLSNNGRTAPLVYVRFEKTNPRDECDRGSFPPSPPLCSTLYARCIYDNPLATISRFAPVPVIRGRRVRGIRMGERQGGEITRRASDIRFTIKKKRFVGFAIFSLSLSSFLVSSFDHRSTLSLARVPLERAFISFLMILLVCSFVRSFRLD